MIDDVAAFGDDLHALMVGTVMACMVVGFAIYTWWKTKSVVSAFAALIGGAFLWAGVMNMTVLRDKAVEDIKGSAPAPAEALTVPGEVSGTGNGP